ncbi:MAG: Lrp/AsnC family transcriptional regulator [Micropruina sp.]|nr:MAG: Lrp/AsnC family transcriptional regulator [Micropruina sp.]
MPTGGSAPEPAKPRPRPKLDDIDRHLIALLSANGRASNASLAAATGTAESTSHARVRALFDAGIITGVHAEVDPAAIGRPLQALIFVRIHPSARGRLQDQAERLAGLPGVLEVFFLGGHHDFIVHVAVADSAALRDFVTVELSSHKETSGTETSIVLEHRRGNQLEPPA